MTIMRRVSEPLRRLSAALVQNLASLIPRRPLPFARAALSIGSGAPPAASLMAGRA
jgi:hypothetical protein